MDLNQFGQNAWQPMARQDTFIPDQLIAGPLQLVTDNGIIASGENAVYSRGTILGRITASGYLTLCVKTATDGSQTPMAVLADNVDASSSEVNAGIYLMGEFNANRIIADDSWTESALKDALRPSSIFLKDVVSAPVSVSEASS